MLPFLKLFWAPLFLLILLIPSFSCKTAETEYVPNEVLIKFKPNTNKSTIDAITEKIGLKEVKKIPHLGVTLYKIQSKMTVQEVVQKYKENPDIEYIEPNYKYKLDW